MRRTAVLGAVLCAAVATNPSGAAESEQGFFRVVEGDAILIRVEDGEQEAAAENTPALAGDRVVLSGRSRVEVILPDGHRLRLANSADLELIALARSLDQEEPATALQLLDGSLAIDVPRDVADRTQIDTDSASVLLERGGLYLVEIDERGATRVVVREGRAEVISEDDATLVEQGEEGVIADRRGRVDLYEAPQLTDVELWAEQLEAEAERADLEPIEPELRYAAAPLQRYGSWVDSGGRYAWRPPVVTGWRPYSNGRWTYSPAGLVWSSYEPWGWVPYHYGRWDLHPSYGWLWYPGAVYSPAHVVWYWGDSYAAWVPSGYYGNHYARRFGFNVSFGSGFYGVSHADWHSYRDWVFCPTSSIGFHNQNRFHRDHHVLENDGGFGGHRRGFITADTGGIEPGRWRDAAAVESAVLRRAHRRTGGERALSDVSAVIARSPEVSSTQIRQFEAQSAAGNRVASHRPNGRSPAGVEASTEPVDRALTPASRVGGRLPGATGPDAARGGAVVEPGVRTAHRAAGGPGDVTSAGAARGGDVTGGARVEGAEAATAPGRTAVRAHRSPGVATPQAGVVDRARRETLVRDRAAGTRPVVRRPAIESTGLRAATVEGQRAVTSRPVARRPVAEIDRNSSVASSPAVVDRSRPVARRPVGEVNRSRSVASSPAVVDRGRPVARRVVGEITRSRSATSGAGVVDRGHPVARRPLGDVGNPERPAARALPLRQRVPNAAASAPRAVRPYSAPAPSVRSDAATVRRSAARSSGGDAQIESPAPVARTLGARAPMVRSAPPAREQGARAPVARSAPAGQLDGARAPMQLAPRAAPAPMARAPRASAFVPAAAPRRQVHAPQRQFQMPQRQLQAPQRQLQAPQRQAQAPQRRVEAARSAPAARSEAATAPPSGGGGSGGNAHARQGARSGGGDRGGGAAERGRSARPH